jgi:protein-tyrosine phosphatase
MLAEDEEEARKSTSLSPDGFYDLIACCYEDLLVVDIRSAEDFRGCHVRGAVHFPFSTDQAESKRHKAIRFYKEMRRLERTWFTRVVVVTDLDGPLTEEADTMPVSPTSTRSCHSKGLEFADVIKNAPGMKHIVAIWIIDGGFVSFKKKYPHLCVSSITVKREEPLFRDATRKIQEYYASMPRDMKVPFASSLASPSSSSSTSPSSSAPSSTSSSSTTTTTSSACTNEACTVEGCKAPAARPVRSLASASKYIKCNPCKWPSKLVDDFLYLGDYETACNPLALKALRIGRVINCTPDRINLWEKRPRKRRRIEHATEGDEDDGERSEGIKSDTSSTSPPSPTPTSTSSPSIPASPLPSSTATPPEQENGEEEEVAEEPMASVLFPDVKIDEYLRIAVLDNYCDNIASYFDTSIAFIEKAKEHSQAVLVHCAQGISRSVTIAIAYLMKVEGMSLREAHDFVRAKRPVSKPNVGFLKQLSAFELQLRGTTSMQT